MKIIRESEKYRYRAQVNVLRFLFGVCFSSVYLLLDNSKEHENQALRKIISAD